MPIYEYACLSCRRHFKKLVGVAAGTAPLECPHCHSKELNRLISRFSRLRNDEDSLDQMAEQLEGLDENDPRAMRRLVREMGKEMGEDMEDDFEQMIEEEMTSSPAATDSAVGKLE